MDLALNNLQWLICHKTKPNPTDKVVNKMRVRFAHLVPTWNFFAWTNSLFFILI